MKIELLEENTAFENILRSKLIIDLYVNDEWLCQIDYLGEPTFDYPYQYQFTSDLTNGTTHLKTISEVMNLIYFNIPNDYKIEMEITLWKR